jgi:hypothetical protein
MRSRLRVRVGVVLAVPSCTSECAAPMQPIHQLGWVDLQAVSQSQQAAEADISLASLDGAHEREVQANALRQRDLTEPEFDPAVPCPLPYGHLGGRSSSGPRHAFQPRGPTR